MTKASFIQYIHSKIRLQPATEAAIMDACQLVSFPKHHLLLEEGRVAQHLHFLVEGSARTYYYHDGKDITSWIYKEEQLVTAWSSFLTQTPAEENIALTEDSTICSISYTALQQLYQTHPVMQTFGRLMMEEQLVFIDTFFKGFMFMTAKQKYDLLQTYFPDVVHRLNLGYVASFLGITQETLSRIRRRK